MYGFHLRRSHGVGAGAWRLTDASGSMPPVARCKGDVWYVGGLTGHEGRTVTLDLGFLGDGNFTAEIFCDGTNAAKYGHDYQRVTRTLGMDRTLEITIAPAGGFALRITRE